MIFELKTKCLSMFNITIEDKGGEKEKRNDDIIEFIERFLECRDQK